jgi:hypothetical protein
MMQELKLKSGRTIRLAELRQVATYEGLLEGLPTAEKNKNLIKRLLADRQNQAHGAPPVMLPFEERRIDLPPEHKYPFGTPSALPSVTVTARFTSLAPTSGADGDGSALVVIWFQHSFAYPPSAELVSQLESLDWERNAGSYEF